jgi:hypothetical protein
MKYVVEMPSCGMIILQSFMKIGPGIQMILKFCLSNLNGCNVGITQGIMNCIVEMGSDGMIHIPSRVLPQKFEWP